MQLKKIEVRNFRLLHKVELLLEKGTTVIVGRNNSGKTSLTEVVSRVLAEGNADFALEDFSSASHGSFWEALQSRAKGEEPEKVRALLPTIEVVFTFEYDAGGDYGTLTDFILDLDPNCREAQVVVAYEIDQGRIEDLFAEIPANDSEPNPEFFRAMRERIPLLYATTIYAVDPNDNSNRRTVTKALLRAACACHCISAHRAPDDETQKESAVIGKVLESLFATAKSDETDSESHGLAKDLEQAVKTIQDKLGGDFNTKLNGLLPALALFGYPGLKDPKLITETTFNVKGLLTNHTKVRYLGSHGVNLPETYNGLGVRNVILILLLLREYFKLYCALDPKPAVHLIFVEEPEVHLHPQMQEVFISKLGEIATKFSSEIGLEWPVQFVVSTHSSHIANAAHFETIRYFMAVLHEGSGEFESDVKDLRKGLQGKQDPERTFLHQYMTLTRCDLFFADKAVLIEGTTERLLLPRAIQSLDKALPDGEKLGSQYLSIVEVGGAYAHLFFELIEFLELKTLIITDIDTVREETAASGKKKWAACPVHLGARSSNACINNWFEDPENKDARLNPAQLLAAKEEQKITGKRRLAYELPESEGGPCGRSFEDAFMLANSSLFPLSGKTPQELEVEAFQDAQEVKKSSFALDHALRVTEWNVPRYIREGLLWLSANDPPLTRNATLGATIA
jgi:energy-coupling factor transporter ATP-binding protein EcfA2